MMESDVKRPAASDTKEREIFMAPEPYHECAADGIIAACRTRRRRDVRPEELAPMACRSAWS